MKYLFDIDRKNYEVTLEGKEVKRVYYEPDKYADVRVRNIGNMPTTKKVGNAYLEVKFSNGNVWYSKDAVIAKLKEDEK